MDALTIHVRREKYQTDRVLSSTAIKNKTNYYFLNFVQGRRLIFEFHFFHSTFFTVTIQDGALMMYATENFRVEEISTFRIIITTICEKYDRQKTKRVERIIYICTSNIIHLNSF